MLLLLLLFLLLPHLGDEREFVVIDEKNFHHKRKVGQLKIKAIVSGIA